MGVGAGHRVEEGQGGVGGVHADPAGEALGHGVHAVTRGGRAPQGLRLVFLEVREERGVAAGKHAGACPSVHLLDGAVRQPPRDTVGGAPVHPGDRRADRAAVGVAQPQPVALTGEGERGRRLGQRGGGLPHDFGDRTDHVVEVLFDAAAGQPVQVAAAVRRAERGPRTVEGDGFGDGGADVDADDHAHGRGTSWTSGLAGWASFSPRTKRPASDAVMAAARCAVCRVAPARCGAATTFGAWCNGQSAGGGSMSYTSRARAPRRPLLSSPGSGA